MKSTSLILEEAKSAKAVLCSLDTKTKNDALLKMAAALEENSANILKENAKLEVGLMRYSVENDYIRLTVDTHGAEADQGNFFNFCHNTFSPFGITTYVYFSIRRKECQCCR